MDDGLRCMCKPCAFVEPVVLGPNTDDDTEIPPTGF